MGELKEEDPVLRLEKELKVAVEEERYVSCVECSKGFVNN
jgi:hypothetical protein